MVVAGDVMVAWSQSFALVDVVLPGFKGVQQRLLSESLLSFKKALSLTQGLETAVQHVKELLGAAVATSQEVHKVASQPAFQSKRKPDKFKGRSTSACYRCGTSGHPAYRCKFKDVECYSCGKKGHYWAVCHSKPKPSGPSHSDIVASRQTIRSFPSPLLLYGLVTSFY